MRETRLAERDFFEARSLGDGCVGERGREGGKAMDKREGGNVMDESERERESDE